MKSKERAKFIENHVIWKIRESYDKIRHASQINANFESFYAKDDIVCVVLGQKLHNFDHF